MEQEAVQLRVFSPLSNRAGRALTDSSNTWQEIQDAVGAPAQYLTRDSLDSMAIIFGVYDAMELSGGWDRWELAPGLSVEPAFSRGTATDEQVDAWLEAWNAWHAEARPPA